VLRKKEVNIVSKKANDALRRSIPYIVAPNLLLVSRGINGLGKEAVDEILVK